MGSLSNRPNPRVYIDRVVAVATGSVSPDAVAQELGVDVATVLAWCDRLAIDTPVIQPNQALGFNAIDVSHTVSVDHSGETPRLVFLVTIRNLFRVRFHALRLIQRSFTDERMHSLTLEEPWRRLDRTDGILEPIGTARFQSSFPLSEDAQRPETEIINAIAVVGLTGTGAWFRVEEDSVWPEPWFDSESRTTGAAVALNEIASR